MSSVALQERTPVPEGDLPPSLPGQGARRTRTRLLDLAPPWITLSEAAFAAGVSHGLMLGWVTTHRIHHVSLLGGDDPAGILVRTRDIRALASSESGLAISVTQVSGPTEEETRTSRSGGLTRRRALVVLGAAVSGGLVPVRALAGSTFADRVRAGSTDALLGGRARTPAAELIEPCKVQVEDGLAASSGVSGGVAAGGATSGGKTLFIRSVTVDPDPVIPGGSATITIDASLKRRNSTYRLTASEGVLTQDPREPWVWTWRDA